MRRSLLQAQFVRPEYFPKGFSLFPTWPAQDPILAAWVFVATMGMLILPKMLAYIVMLTHKDERKRFGGSFRALGGILAAKFLPDGAGDDDLSIVRGRRDPPGTRCGLAGSTP